MPVISKNRLKELIKLHNKKYRSEQGLILVEGRRLLDQLHRNGVVIEEIFCNQEKAGDLQNLSPKLITLCENWQLEKLSQTSTSQQVIGLIKSKRQPIEKTDFLLYLDNISDPGNLGTIFRTAMGLGVDGIITSPGCCEIFNPKVVRASMGAVVIYPIAERDYEWLLNQNAAIIVTVLENSKNISEIKEIKKPCILVIGSEANGVDDQIIRAADIKLRIPMYNRMESLNAAVAAGIAIYYIISDGYIKR